MFGHTVNDMPAGWQHLCGLFYTMPSQGRLEKFYLPQVELEAHATVLSTTSRTTLTQRFTNPSREKGIKEVKYTFPLYDGVSVVGFTCLVGDRTIVGVVKEKEKARRDFTEAVSRGQTAALFAQLDTADVFSTTIGNVPPGTDVIINITYLAELKHDMEVDGIRYTIPNIIAPRYGRMPQAYYSSTAQNAVGSRISITVDVEMAEGSFVQKIMSPSHPIAVSMGTLSIAPLDEPTMAKASATLSLGSAQLGNDFVLQIVAKDTGVPKAILETHPTIPNQRALMATLVPKFVLPPDRPEVVFVCDRSGSMNGSNIMLAKQALQVFLKSLPVGVMFNVCYFGSSYRYLWPKSMLYSQATLDQAVGHVNSIEADYGGTEMLAPLRGVVANRNKDLPLEVMLLTDGETWEQQELFAFINEQVSEKKQPIRFFTLGVGAAVSHSLIEGVARAGNGFSQTAASGEKMDAKVVRMLKGALSPHVSDYTLEVKYAASMTPNSEDDDEDYDIVEKVADLKIKLDVSDDAEKEAKLKKPISLFDTSMNPDQEPLLVHKETGENRYEYLPKLHTPNIIQAPQSITTLFAFNRTTVYLLLGSNAPRQVPKSVILRGTSTHGPLELEFPIQVLDTPGEMIHQLAAKKAIAELEQGRGWLLEARNEDGKLVKEQFSSQFSSIVEREAVRLGVQFQVGGKWCSFVAVEKDQKSGDDQDMKDDWECLEDEVVPPPSLGDAMYAPAQHPAPGSLFGSLPPPPASLRSPFAHNTAAAGGLFANKSNIGQNHTGMATGSGLFGSVAGGNGAAALPASSATMFGQASTQTPPAEQPGFAVVPPAYPENLKLLEQQSQQRISMSHALRQQQAQQEAQVRAHYQAQHEAQARARAQAQAQYQAQQQAHHQPHQMTQQQARQQAQHHPAQQQMPRNQQREQQQMRNQQYIHSGSAQLFTSNATPRAGINDGQPGLPQSPHALQDFQMQLMLLEQQNKSRLLMTRAEQANLTGQYGSLERQTQQHQAPAREPGNVSSSPAPAASYAPPAFVHTSTALQDYQMQRMLLEKDRKRVYMARQEKEESENEEQEGSPKRQMQQHQAPARAPEPISPAPAPAPAPALPAPASGYIEDSPFEPESRSEGPRDELDSFDFQSFLHVDNGQTDFAAPTSNAAPQASKPPGSGVFGSAITFGRMIPTPASGPSSPVTSGGLFGNATSSDQQTSAFGASLFAQAPHVFTPESGSAPPSPEPTLPASPSDEQVLTFLIAKQTYMGFWVWQSSIFNAIGISERQADYEGPDLDNITKNEWLTALVLAWIEERLEGLRGSWELVVGKGRDWLEDMLGEEDMMVMCEKAGEMVG